MPPVAALIAEMPCPAVLSLAGPPPSSGLHVVPKAEVEVLGERIVALSGQLAAASCRWLLLVAQFDAAEGFGRFGLGSTASWLAFSCGLARRTAVEHVRVARALAAFPPLAAGMGAGRLSYSHVRAISRAVRPGEDQLLDDLIMIAENGRVTHLEAVVRGLRTAQDNDREHERHRDRDREGDGDGNGGEGQDPAPEWLRGGWDEQSRWRISGQLDAEHGALVDAAIGKIMTVQKVGRPQALVVMAELALAALRDEKAAAPALRSEERAAIVVHINADQVPAPVGAEPAAEPASATPPAPGPQRRSRRTRSRGRGPHHGPHHGPGRGTSRAAGRAPSGPAGRPFGRIAGGPGLPAAVIERLACAGRIRPIVWSAQDGAGQRHVLDVGRSQRVVTERQFRALMLRDHGHCTHPGCPTTTGLQAHHVKHWLHGGKTNMANLVLLCAHHHHAHHDGDFSIQRRGSTFAFTGGDGTPLPMHSNPGANMRSEMPIEQAHTDVEPDAAATRWDGQHLDLGYAVSVLTHRREQCA